MEFINLCLLKVWLVLLLYIIKGVLIMGILEDTLVTLKSAAGIAVEKTEKIIDVSKLKINLSEQERKLSKCFEDLGKLTYNKSKNSDANDEENSKIIAQIDNLYEQIKNINDQIALSKNQIRCKRCGYDNDNNAFYCGKCGSLLREEVNDENICE